MPGKSVTACCLQLEEKKLRIAFAESASTGRFIYEFTSVPDCGDIVKGSIVCYDRSVKESLLKVPPEVIDQYSAESPEVTGLLAEGLRKLIPADVIIAVTGLASPGGSESVEKPVGTMFVHGYVNDQPWQKKFLFSGTPDEIIAQTIEATARTVLELLKPV